MQLPDPTTSKEIFDAQGGYAIDPEGFSDGWDEAEFGPHAASIDGQADTARRGVASRAGSPSDLDCCPPGNATPLLECPGRLVGSAVHDAALPEPLAADEEGQHQQPSLAVPQTEGAGPVATPRADRRTFRSPGVAIADSHAAEATAPCVAKRTPILALPPPSQLDAAVLDALPLAVKRELEYAYGVTAPLPSCFALDKPLNFLA